MKFSIQNILLAITITLMFLFGVLYWLARTTSGLQFALCASTGRVCRIERLDGDFARGFSFAKWDLSDEARDFVIEGARIDLSGLWTSLLQARPRLVHLRIDRIFYQQLILEKPQLERVRGELEKVVNNLRSLRLVKSYPSEIRIESLEIGRVEIIVAIGTPALRIGPIAVREFLVDRTAWSADRFDCSGDTVSLQKNKDRLVLAAHLDSKMFANADGPLLFRSEF